MSVQPTGSFLRVQRGPIIAVVAHGTPGRAAGRGGRANRNRLHGIRNRFARSWGLLHCRTIFLAPSGIAEKSLWGLIGALMGGISLMIRGLHREATMSAYRWRGMVAAYEAQQVSKTIVQKLDAIVIEYLQREVRHGGRSKRSKAE